MEEVIGSIPIRSTNYFKHLVPPPFGGFLANSKTRPLARFAGIAPTSAGVLIDGNRRYCSSKTGAGKFRSRLLTSDPRIHGTSDWPESCSVDVKSARALTDSRSVP
jgi:hypothetical protein